MAKHARQMEGNEEQRRAAAREAREKGMSASEAGATQGASKQRRKAKNPESHQEKLEMRDHGKQGGATRNSPRPGNREEDPKRTDRWE